MEFYLQHGTESRGPYRKEEVIALLQEGVFGKQDAIRAKGMEKWAIIRDIPALAKHANSRNSHGLPVRVAEPIDIAPPNTPSDTEVAPADSVASSGATQPTDADYSDTAQ